MSDVKIISKMSVKTIGCNPKKVAAIDKKDGEPTPVLPLCRIYGKASGLKHGEDPRTSQVFTAIIGEFEAVNLQTNEVFRAGKLFLPGGIQEVLEAPLAEADKNDAQVSIKFGFEIAAVQADNPIGYSYQAKPLFKPAQDDALAEMRNLLSAPAQPQLEAPKVETPSAPKPEEKHTPKKTK